MQITEAYTPHRPVAAALEPPGILAVASSVPAVSAAGFALLERAGLRACSTADKSGASARLAPEGAPGPMENWPEWLAANPQGHLLLLVPIPSLAVARMLAQGTAPEKALGAWMESVQSVLQVVRPQRRRVTLVFAEAALAAPQAFLDALSQRLQLQLNPVGAHDQRREMPGALLRMMAENAIRQSAEARQIATELEASALPVESVEFAAGVAIEEVFQEYSEGNEVSARAAGELREENELLLAQLHQVQEELESKFLQAQQLEGKLAEVEKQRSEEAQKFTAVADSDPRLQDLQEENELLLQQLHHVQEELEHYYLQSTQINSAEVAELQRRLQAAEETVQDLYSSKSWKITRPLRWVLDLLTGGSKTASP